MPVEPKSDPSTVIQARALWVEAPGVARLRGETLPEPGAGEARVACLWSAVSRGTERLVFTGRVPASQAETMRAPFQQGAFSLPVKSG